MCEKAEWSPNTKFPWKEKELKHVEHVERMQNVQVNSQIREEIVSLTMLWSI